MWGNLSSGNRTLSDERLGSLLKNDKNFDCIPTLSKSQIY
jgi:hypothetical protein